jgi:septum formation protein
MRDLVLASGSTSRRAVLQAAGVVFDWISPDVDEDAVKAEQLVIGADQTLDLNGRLFDKPQNRENARETLRALRGRTHVLHSAVAVCRDGEVIWRTCETVSLTMWAFDDFFLDAYLAEQGEALLSSVGAYLVEGRGIQLFEKIDGDYFAILGLPLLPLLAFLRKERG